MKTSSSLVRLAGLGLALSLILAPVAASASRKEERALKRARKLMALLQRVDGRGSGLDADMLQGYTPEQFRALVTGPIGPVGPRGAQGDQGVAGPRGEKGETGATGSVGSSGAPGGGGTVVYDGGDSKETVGNVVGFNGSGLVWVARPLSYEILVEGAPTPVGPQTVAFAIGAAGLVDTMDQAVFWHEQANCVSDPAYLAEVGALPLAYVDVDAQKAYFPAPEAIPKQLHARAKRIFASEASCTALGGTFKNKRECCFAVDQTITVFRVQDQPTAPLDIFAFEPPFTSATTITSPPAP